MYVYTEKTISTTYKNKPIRKLCKKRIFFTLLILFQMIDYIMTRNTNALIFSIRYIYIKYLLGHIFYQIFFFHTN